MRRAVSQECLDCIMEDIRDASIRKEAVPVHPEVLRRMIEEIVVLRVVELSEAL